MPTNFSSKPTTRRELLRAGAALAGTGALTAFFPGDLVAFRETQVATPQQPAVSATDQLAERKAQMAAIPLQTTKLREDIYLLSGPGGNMVVLNGPDGKILVDSSFAAVAPKIKAAMESFSPAPLKILINTHWHFDHTDGNEAMHNAGAMIIAHENARRRLSTPQDIALFGMHFDPSPAAALPQQTFTESAKIYFNGEELSLAYFPPAHTDGDIYVRYERGNVLHMGDVLFNGMYPFLDPSTGGNIHGMIAGTARGMTLADADTIIVPGHGPVGDKGNLAKHHDMLVTVRDRVHALKSAGKSQAEAIAAKPTADLDAVWAKGAITPDFFTTLVYMTL